MTIFEVWRCFDCPFFLMPEATWEREKCKLDKDVIPQRGGMSSPSQIPPKTCPLRKEDAVVRMVQYDEFLTSERKLTTMSKPKETFKKIFWEWVVPMSIGMLAVQVLLRLLGVH